MRETDAIKTEYDGEVYRSRTEARWAVFFKALNIKFSYEKHHINLSNGQIYVPDFYLIDFSAWFEVKPENDAIVTEEAAKARRLAADKPDELVWLAMGPPNGQLANVLTLDQWKPEIPIEEILSTPENRYLFLEDRRDEDVYWLQADFVTGGFRHSFMVGGPGISTDHDRLPLLHRRVAVAYKAAHAQRW